MKNKIENLKKDIGILVDCIDGIEKRIDLLRQDPAPDLGQISKLMREKTDCQKLLDEDVTLLRFEEAVANNRAREIGLGQSNPVQIAAQIDGAGTVNIRPRDDVFVISSGTKTQQQIEDENKKKRKDAEDQRIRDVVANKSKN